MSIIKKPTAVKKGNNNLWINSFKTYYIIKVNYIFLNKYIQLLGISLILYKNYIEWWREKDSNLRTHKRADLQSAAFNHSAIPPLKLKYILQYYILEINKNFFN